MKAVRMLCALHREYVKSGDLRQRRRCKPKYPQSQIQEAVDLSPEPDADHIRPIAEFPFGNLKTRLPKPINVPWA